MSGTGVMMDIDGVLADFVNGFTRLGNELFGLPVKDNRDQGEWSWTGSRWCTQEQEGAIWKAIRSSDTFWSGLKPLDNVGDETLDVIADEHRRQPIVFVTSRVGDTAWEQTIEWLEDRGIRRPLVVVSSRELTKPSICRGLGLQIAIEDAPAQLAVLYEAGIETVKVAWPYNAGCEARYTVGSVGEALDLLDIPDPELEYLCEVD